MVTAEEALKAKTRLEDRAKEYFKQSPKPSLAQGAAFKPIKDLLETGRLQGMLKEGKTGEVWPELVRKCDEMIGW
jgi:hypothetical protein